MADKEKKQLQVFKIWVVKSGEETGFWLAGVVIDAHGFQVVQGTEQDALRVDRVAGDRIEKSLRALFQSDFKYKLIPEKETLKLEVNKN